MLAYDAAGIRNLDDDAYHPQRRPGAEGRAACARRPPRPVDGSRAPEHPKEALGGEKPRAEPNLAEAIRRRFLPLGGADELEPHPPVPVRDPPRFDQ